jgi:hypothetical protein
MDCRPYLDRVVQALRQANVRTVLLLQLVLQVALQVLGWVQRQDLRVRCMASHMV